MSKIICLLFSLLLILTGPDPLRAKPPVKKDKITPATSGSVKDLEAATAELQENIKDLRRNITSWRKIQQDAGLSQAEKKNWHTKAGIYLAECEAYDETLKKIDAKKLPRSEVSSRFLTERQTFQREMHYLRETLQGP